MHAKLAVNEHGAYIAADGASSQRQPYVDLGRHSHDFTLGRVVEISGHQDWETAPNDYSPQERQRPEVIVR